jgi:hypothetical protein
MSVTPALAASSNGVEVVNFAGNPGSRPKTCSGKSPSDTLGVVPHQAAGARGGCFPRKGAVAPRTGGTVRRRSVVSRPWQLSD